MIGTALVGLGEVGQVHLRALASHAGSQLRVLCDLDSELLARDAHNAASTTRDLDELLADAEVAAVSICLPHHLHEPVAIRCLEAGKHVLLEKPITMTAAQADRVLAIARATGRRVGVSHNQVFFRPHAEARRMIVAGELGTVHQLRARLVIGGTYGAWRSDPALAGGGLLIDAGVHRIYTLRHLAGEILAVSAVMRDPGNEEAFIVTLEHESGAVRTRSLESSTRTLVSASLVALLLLLLAGCGVDNPGEPRGEAEQIAAPNLGDVHVYCVESEHVAITPCSVRLDVRGRHSPVEIRDWWLRASHDLVTAGTVSGTAARLGDSG